MFLDSKDNQKNSDYLFIKFDSLINSCLKNKNSDKIFSKDEINRITTKFAGNNLSTTNSNLVKVKNIATKKKKKQGDKSPVNFNRNEKKSNKSGINRLY